jgi:hypothetical protein
MIYELIYLFVCIALAYVNYRIIIADKRVYHALNGLVHIACWITVYLITRNWVLVAILPFIARLFFDVMLNLMRGLPINYVPKNPKSIADKVEKQVFGQDGLTPKAIYLAIIIILNFFV